MDVLLHLATWDIMHTQDQWDCFLDVDSPLWQHTTGLYSVHCQSETNDVVD